MKTPNPSPRDQPLPSELPLVRSASLRGYRELVSRLGGNPEVFLEQSGLKGVDINDEEKLVPVHCLCNALEIASRELRITDFGLRLSLYQDLDVLGPLAILIQNARSLSDIIDTMTRHGHKIHNQSEQLFATIENNQLLLQHVNMIPNAISTVQISLLGFGFAARMAQERLEPSLIAKAIYFTHEKPKDYQRYRDIFKTDIYFNQTFSGATVDTNTLQKEYRVKPVRVVNIESLVVSTSEKSNNPTYSQPLRILISQTLASSDKGLSFYANQLGISERTLQRKLKSEGQSFKNLVDQVRKDTAARYIDARCYNMGQISEMLGFSDPAVFTRAFRRWYGVTPKVYSRTMTPK